MEVRLDGAGNGDFREREYPPHHELKTGVVACLRDSELCDVISARLIFLMIVPFVLPEIVLTL
jgi:hypothetical protein